MSRPAFSIGLTDHLEGPSDRPSGEVYGEVAELIHIADEGGVRYAWFAEHHAHVHRGHLPTPLLLALHLAGQTRRIALGAAVVCLNLHSPLHVAEEVAVIDALAAGRTCVGFGSGSTPEEARLFGARETGESERHAQFAGRLQAVFSVWSNPRSLPAARPDLRRRCWAAVNSVGAARAAGEAGLNALFSHLRTTVQYREYIGSYRAAGGGGLIAANRPVYVGDDDATAMRDVEPALRALWRRFRAEGKIPAHVAEPELIADLCGHPINFIAGGPETVARQLMALHAEVPFDVANVEVRWDGLSHETVTASLRRFTERVMPLLMREW